MTAILLNVRKRVAYAQATAVTGNGYAVQVTLDDEWEGAENIRVRAVAGGAYQDYPVSEGSAEVLMPEDVPAVELGVWSDTLHTTAPARVRLLPSVLDATEGLTEVQP